MLGFPASAPSTVVSAVEPSDTQIFLPLIKAWQDVWFDDFADLDPVWEYRLLKEDPKDGFFEHLGGKYAAHIRDNSALMIATPWWRTPGDFKLEVDGRHLDPDKKSFNGLGLAFSADDDWTGFYSMIIAAGAAQHFWAVVRYEKAPSGRYKAEMLTNNGYRGGPTSMKNYSGTNRLMIVRIGDTIRPYNNGSALPTGDGHFDVQDNHYGPNRVVGLVVTSYEFSNGEIDFDNFELTHLYNEDPETYDPNE
jgi:hypothetical protein